MNIQTKYDMGQRIIFNGAPGKIVGIRLLENEPIFYDVREDGNWTPKTATEEDLTPEVQIRAEDYTMRSFQLTLYTSRGPQFRSATLTDSGWNIDSIPVLNTPVAAADLRPGDMFTQLSLNDTPENFWVVDEIEPSSAHGHVIRMTNGSKLCGPAHARFWLQYRAE